MITSSINVMIFGASADNGCVCVCVCGERDGISIEKKYSGSRDVEINGKKDNAR